MPNEIQEFLLRGRRYVISMYAFLRTRFLELTLLSLACTIAMTACGTSSQGLPQPTHALPSGTSARNQFDLGVGKPTAIVQSGLRIAMSGATFDINGNYIPQQAANGSPALGIDCGPMLVLASDSTNLSPSEVRQVSQYISTLRPHFVNENMIKLTPDYPDAAQPSPAPLKWVQGAPHVHHCMAELQITNESSSAIQIAKAGFQLSQNATSNDFRYHLVDECSVSHCEYAGPGTGTQLCAYSAQVKLPLFLTQSPGAAPVVSNGVTIRGPCPKLLTIMPNQTSEVIIDFTLPDGVQRNEILEGIPYLNILSSSGSQTVNLSRDETSLVFADAEQFDCLALTDGKFVKEGNLNLRTSLGRASSVERHLAYCL